jgi:hypothetical protein
MRKHLITFGIVLASALIAGGLITALLKYGGPDRTTKKIFNNLLSATLADDYDAFAAECDDPMKAALTKTVLTSLSQQLQTRAKAGYDAQYLGSLKKQVYQVYLWRIHFNDEGDDLLATLSVKDGKAGGFYLR